MLKALIDLDHRLFLGINHLPHNIFLDYFFGFLSGISYGGILWIIIGLGIFFFEENKDRFSLFAQITAGILSFVITDVILKNVFDRTRPQFNLDNVYVVFESLKTYSFPSGHSSFAFAMAYVLTYKHRKYWAVFYLFASLIAFSRIYLGKHYPADVFAGIIIGTLIGIVSIVITSSVKKKYGRNKRKS